MNCINYIHISYDRVLELYAIHGEISKLPPPKNRECVRRTGRAKWEEGRKGRKESLSKEEVSAGSQIAMKPGTDASRGFHITTGPPMMVLPISFASPTDTHPSIDPDALANSCSEELRARTKSGSTDGDKCARMLTDRAVNAKLKPRRAL